MGKACAFNGFCEEVPESDELIRNKLIFEPNKGHIAWDYSPILELGVSGFKAKVEEHLKSARDTEAEEFYKGVIIMLDAMQDFSDKHIAEYERLGYEPPLSR